MLRAFGLLDKVLAVSEAEDKIQVEKVEAEKNVQKENYLAMCLALEKDKPEEWFEGWFKGRARVQNNPVNPSDCFEDNMPILTLAVMKGLEPVVELLLGHTPRANPNVAYLKPKLDGSLSIPPVLSIEPQVQPDRGDGHLRPLLFIHVGETPTNSPMIRPATPVINNNVATELDTNPGYTPLFFAIAIGNIALCKRLVAAGAELTGIAYTKKHTALSIAIMFGNVDLVKFFLPLCNPMQVVPCQPGKTLPLVNSAIFQVLSSMTEEDNANQVEVFQQELRFMLEMGKPNLSLDAKSRECILTLLLADSRVDIRIKNDDEKTALMYLIRRKYPKAGDRALIKLLVRAECEHPKPIKDTELVVLAMCDNRVDVMEAIIEAGIVPNKPYDFVRKGIEVTYTTLPLAEAAKNNNITMVRALLTCKTLNRSQFSIVSGKKNTPLMMVAKAGYNTEMAGVLIDGGAWVEGGDLEGNTPLMSAVENKKPHMILYLLLRGADPYRLNLKGKCAYLLAESKLKTFMRDIISHLKKNPNITQPELHDKLGGFDRMEAIRGPMRLNQILKKIDDQSKTPAACKTKTGAKQLESNKGFVFKQEKMEEKLGKIVEKLNKIKESEKPVEEAVCSQPLGQLDKIKYSEKTKPIVIFSDFVASEIASFSQEKFIEDLKSIVKESEKLIKDSEHKASPIRNLKF